MEEGTRTHVLFTIKKCNRETETANTLLTTQTFQIAPEESHPVVTLTEESEETAI